MKFISSGSAIITSQNVRPKPMKWGRTAIRLTHTHNKGVLRTSKGREVEAFKLVENSVETVLFDIDTGLEIPKPGSYFSQFQFDPSYNCFGYCFAGGNVWITDPSQIIQDDFVEVDLSEAEIILFKEFQQFGDNGETNFINSHAAMLLPNGNVSFKPGVNRLIENVSIDLAIHDYNFNHRVYLRKIAI